MKSSLFEKTRLVRIATIATLCALLVTTSLLVIRNMRMETLKHETWKTFPLNSPTDSGSVVNLLVFDDNDQLWIAINRAGLKVLASDGNLTSYTQNNSELTSDVIKAIAIDNQGRVWIGTEDGLNVLSPSEGWVTYTKENSALQHDFVDAVAIDKNNRVWIGTDYGLYLLSPDENDKIEEIAIDSEDRTWSGDRVWVEEIAIDSEGRVWIGTGSYIYMRDTNGKWKNFDINIVEDLAIDVQNRVWVSTSYGGDVIMIGTDDKLKSHNGGNSYYTGSIATDNKMQVWFAGEYGNSGPFFGGGTGNYIGMLTPDGQWKSISLKNSGLSEGSYLDFAVAIDRQERVWVGQADSVSVADPNLLQTQMDLFADATLLKWSSILLAVVLAALTIKGLPATISNRVFGSEATQKKVRSLFLRIVVGMLGFIIGGVVGFTIGINIGASLNQGLGIAVVAGYIGAALCAILGAVIFVRAFRLSRN